MSDCPIHGVRSASCDSECVELAAALRRSHECHEHAVEHGDEPRPNGVLTITTRCGVCGRKLSQGTDRVLWAY